MTEPSADGTRWIRRLRILMIGLLAGAAVAHVLATLQPPFVDESFYTRNLQNFFNNRTILPAFYFYPTLYSYMVAPVTGLFAGGMVLAGMPPSIGDWREVSYFDRIYALWPQRLVVLICFAVACWLTYLIVLELTQRRWAGLLGATLLVTSPGTLQYAGFGVADIPMVMFTTAAILYGLRLSRRERVRRNALLAGLFGGLAVATKYNAAAVAPPLLVAIWAGGSDSRGRARLLGMAAAAAVAGFIAGCPGWLIAPAEFVEGIGWQANRHGMGHMGIIGVPLLGQLETTLASDPHLLVLALAGAAIAVRVPDRRWQWGTLVAMVASVYLLSVPGARQAPQYLLPAWPMLAALVAWGVAAAGGRLKMSLGALAAVAMIAACGLILFQGFRMAAVPQSERVARSWLHTHVEPMTPIAVDWAYVPDLIDSEELADLTGGIETEYVRDLYSTLVPYEVSEIRYQREFLDETESRYIITSSGCYERFFKFGVFAHRPPDPDLRVRPTWESRVAFYEDLFAGYGGWRPVYDVWTGNGPRVVIFARGETLKRHGAQSLTLP